MLLAGKILTARAPHFGAFSRAFLRRIPSSPFTPPLHYARGTGTILRRIHLENRNATTLRIIKLNSIARRFRRGDYFPRDYRRFLSLPHHSVPAPPSRVPALFAVNNPRSTEASSQLGIVEEALAAGEKFLESRREIKSPTVTRASR